MAGQCCQCDHGRCEGCRAELLNPSTETLIAEATFCSSGWEGLSSGIAELSTNTNGIFPHSGSMPKAVQNMVAGNARGLSQVCSSWVSNLKGGHVVCILQYIYSINAGVLDLEPFIYKIGGLPLSLVTIYYLSTSW